jgi:LysM repeat protein
MRMPFTTFPPLDGLTGTGARPGRVRIALCVVGLLLGFGLAGCGESDGALTTLPPIRSTTTTSSTTTTTLPFERRFHEVQSGETLSVIAERYGVSVAAIVDLNNITNPDRIEAGVTLEIPDRARVP